MKISFKYYFLGLAAVAVFLPVLYFGAPLILRVVDAVTATPPPSEEEVCRHLEDDLDVHIEDCPSWLASSEEAFGEYYPARLRCYAAASSQDEAVGCDEPIEYMRSTWN